MEDILRKLVAFRSTADDVAATHQALDYVASFVAVRGMHVERYESNGHESLVATIKPGNKTPKVMLAAHLDVLPAPDELFELRKSGGKLYGRGVLDMKYAIASYLQIIDEQQDSLQDLDFGLMITTDEELGGVDGVGQLVTEGYLPQVCVLPDGDDNWQIQLFSKGFLYIQLQAYGTPAHGSRPWLGDNAILPLMDAIRDIQALFVGQSTNTPTLNVGKIQGGTAANQVADYAEALIDIRFNNHDEKQTILQQVQDICTAHGVTLSVHIDGDTTSYSLDNPYIAPFAQLITEVTGVTVTGSRTLGTNDTRFYTPYNVPCISFYPTGDGHHGPEEWIDEKAFYQFKEIIDRYLQQMARVS